MALLELKDISKTFYLDLSKLTVLHDITFSIQKGEFLALTGQSGSGKSTLMKIIGCLDIASGGTYTIDGVDTAQLGPDELAHIRNKKVGFAFQQFYLLPDLTAQENVALPQLYGGSDEKAANKRAAELLERIGLSDHMRHFPYQLSGGQQQRVAIARALANNPAIILADEPTGNLDSQTGKQIIDLFAQLNKTQNTTIIIVTHDKTIAQQTHRVIKLLDGKIVEDTKNNIQAEN